MSYSHTLLMITISMLDAAFFVIVNLELFYITEYTFREQLPVLLFVLPPEGCDSCE